MMWLRAQYVRANYVYCRKDAHLDLPCSHSINRLKIYNEIHTRRCVTSPHYKLRAQNPPVNRNVDTHSQHTHAAIIEIDEEEQRVDWGTKNKEKS